MRLGVGFVLQQTQEELVVSPGAQVHIGGVGPVQKLAAQPALHARELRQERPAHAAEDAAHVRTIPSYHINAYV